MRSFRYTESYRHEYLDFQMYRGGGKGASGIIALGGGKGGGRSEKNRGTSGVSY